MDREVSQFGRSAEALINSAPCGMQSLDPEGRFLAINDTELRWLGYGHEELLGLPMAEVLAIDSLPAFKNAYESLKKAGESVELDVKLVRKDGTSFPALLTMSALRSESGKFLQSLGVVYDLTERRRHEREESERERAARQREFVANVSHELRTPLAAILGFTETLREGALNDPKLGGRFLSTIERHAHRLLGLVDDVLEVSERDAGRKPPRRERVELRPELKTIAEGLQPVARKNRITLSVSAPKGLAVSADRSQLGQVLSNLIGNALKYNRRGGRVRVSARQVQGNGVQLSVADTGIGIAEDELPYLFDRFHRSKDPKARQKKGTGLGLAIVKSIVRAHGGRIWAESKLGKGTCFHVALPEA